jgi:hypothetical protein
VSANGSGHGHANGPVRRDRARIAADLRALVKDGVVVDEPAALHPHAYGIAFTPHALGRELG